MPRSHPIFPQSVENSGDNPVDSRWTPVDAAPRTVDEQWTVRPQMMRIVRGRTVDDDYRGPHGPRNYTRVMGTAVDERRSTPHPLHTPDGALTCGNGHSSTVSTPLTTTMNLSTSPKIFSGPVGKSRAGATP